METIPLEPVYKGNYDGFPNPVGGKGNCTRLRYVLTRLNGCGSREARIWCKEATLTAVTEDLVRHGVLQVSGGQAHWRGRSPCSSG